METVFRVTGGLAVEFSAKEQVPFLVEPIMVTFLLIDLWYNYRASPSPSVSF